MHLSRLQVDGKEYFKCKERRGVLVPADKVTWHGHRVSKVLAEQRFNIASKEEIEWAEHHK
jgi:hypothetical protein